MSFKGLANGKTYDLRCSCENSVGYGSYTGALTVIPYGKPFGVTAPPKVLESSEGKITVRVSPLPDHNGNALTKIRCTSTPGDKKGEVLNPGISSSADITIQGLDKISTYIIKCQGINAAGAGNFSGASNSS